MSMWNYPIRTSAAAGKPTRATWTSCLSPCKAACLKSCGNSMQIFTRIKNGGDGDDGNIRIPRRCHPCRRTPRKRKMQAWSLLAFFGS